MMGLCESVPGRSIYNYYNHIGLSNYLKKHVVFMIHGWEIAPTSLNLSPLPLSFKHSKGMIKCSPGIKLCDFPYNEMTSASDNNEECRAFGILPFPCCHFLYMCS